MLFSLVHRVAGVVVGPGQEHVRNQEVVSGERLQSEVSGPFCRHPLLGCIDGSSVRRRQERVGCQIVTDDLQAASHDCWNKLWLYEWHTSLWYGTRG